MAPKNGNKKNTVGPVFKGTAYERRQGM